MDDIYLKMFNIIGITDIIFKEHNDILIERDILLSNEKYTEIQHLIPELKKNLSSTTITCLHKNASENQRWPLLNLVRQILKEHNYDVKSQTKFNSETGEKIKLYVIRKPNDIIEPSKLHISQLRNYKIAPIIRKKNKDVDIDLKDV